MIFVITKINALPGKSQEFIQTMQALVARMRNRKGCQSCHLYRDVDNKNAFGLVMAWEAEEDLDNLLRSDDIAVYRAVLDLLSEPADIKFGRVLRQQELGILNDVEVMMKGQQY